MVEETLQTTEVKNQNLNKICLSEAEDQNQMVEGQRSENTTKHVKTMAVKSAGQPQVPDGGWGYAVILGVFISVMVLGGYNRCTPLVYQELYEKFGQSATKTASLFSVNGIILTTTSPLASMSCNRFGVRASVIFGTVLSSGGLIASAWPPSLWYMYITYGIIFGVGVGFISTSNYIIVGQYFDKYKGKAYGIASMGDGTGGFIIPPLATLFFEHYGYSGTMLLFGGFLLHTLISAALFRPLTLSKKEIQEMRELEEKLLVEEATERKENCDASTVYESPEQSSSVLETRYCLENATGKKSEKSLRDSTKNIRKGPCASNINTELLKDKKFMSFSFMSMCLFGGFSCVLTFFVALAKERGITNHQYAIMLMITAITDLIGRFSSGFVFDLKVVKQRRMLLFLILVLIYSAFVIILPFAHDFATFLTITIFCTIFGSAFHAQHNTVLTDMVGRKSLASAIGISRAIMGLGGIIGPTIGGFLRDWSGEYCYTYYYGGSLSGVGILIVIILNYRYVISGSKVS